MSAIDLIASTRPMFNFPDAFVVKSVLLGSFSLLVQQKRVMGAIPYKETKPFPGPTGGVLVVFWPFFSAWGYPWKMTSTPSPVMAPLIRWPA